MQTKGDIREENALSGKVSNYNNIVSSFKGLKDIYETEVVKGKDQNGNDVDKVQYKVGQNGKPVINAQKLEDYLRGHQQLAQLADIAKRADDTKDQTMVSIINNHILSQFALAHFELGEGDALKEKLNNIANISDDDLAMLGFDPTSKQEGLGKVKESVRKIEQLEELYNNIQENVLDSKVAEAKRRKLFELGSMQQALIDEYGKASATANLLEKAKGIPGEANRLIAAEKAAQARVDGLQKMVETQELSSEMDMDILKDAYKDLEDATNTKNKFIEDNKEYLKEGVLGPVGYYNGDNSNAILDAKRNKELEKAAGLQYSLVDTTNQFNRIAHPRTGDSYFAKTSLMREVMAGLDDSDLDDFSDRDLNFLNERLTTLAGAAKYDELTDLYPRLLDKDYPVNQKLAILKRLYNSNPLAKELFDAFEEDVKEFRSQVSVALREKKEKEAELKKATAQSEDNKKLEAEFRASTDSTSGIPSNNGINIRTVEERDTATKNEASKKPIATFVQSTITREEDSAPGNHVDRSQHFFINTENSKDRSKYRMVMITRANEQSLKAKGIIDALYNGTTDPNEGQPGREPIAVLFVLQDGNSIYPVDQNGEPLTVERDGKKIKITLGSEDLNVNQAIFAILPSTELNNSEGKPRHAGASEEVAKQYKEAWTKKREEILALEPGQILAYQYETSRGFNKRNVTQVDGVNKYESNPIVGTLITLDDLQKNAGIIQVPTTQKININNKDIVVTAGAPILVHGNMVEYLQNRNLTQEEVNNIYDLIRFLAREVNGENKKSWKSAEVSAITSYLQNILYFSSPFDHKDPTKRLKSTSPNQVYIKSGMVVFGLPGNRELSVPFTDKALEKDKGAILQVLAGMYNNVNSNTLTKNKDFVEVKVRPDGTLSVEKWPSYREFLVATKNLDGSNKTPLLTTIVRKKDPSNPTDRNRGGIYATDKGLIDTSAIKEEPAKAKVPAKQEPKEPEKVKIIRAQKVVPVGKGFAYFDVYDDDLTITDIKNSSGDSITIPEENMNELYAALFSKEFPELVAKKAEELAAAAEEDVLNEDPETVTLRAQDGSSVEVALYSNDTGFVILMTDAAGNIKEVPKEAEDKIVQLAVNQRNAAKGHPTAQTPNAQAA